MWVIQQPISCVKRWPHWWGGWRFMVPPLHSHGLGSIPSWPEFRSQCYLKEEMSQIGDLFLFLWHVHWDVAGIRRSCWQTSALSCTDVQKKAKEFHEGTQLCNARTDRMTNHYHQEVSKADGLAASSCWSPVRRPFYTNFLVLFGLVCCKMGFTLKVIFIIN